MKIPWAVSGPQIDEVVVVLDRTHVGPEHQVEGPWLGEAVLGAAIRAGVRIGQLVEAEALIAVAALHQGIGEDRLVTRSLPHLTGLEDGRVEADHVVPLLDHGPPPLVLDVPQQLNPERAVVVGGANPAVDLGGLEDEAALLGEVGDRVEADRHGRRQG